MARLTGAKPNCDVWRTAARSRNSIADLPSQPSQRDDVLFLCFAQAMAPKPPSLSLKLIDLVNFSILHFQQAEVRADVKNPFVERQTGITKVRVVGQGSNLTPQSIRR
jgi:hypothetical protein